MRYFYSFIVSVTPLILYLLILETTDKNKRQSFRLIILNFFWGILGAIILVVIHGFTLFKGFYQYKINTYEINSMTVIIFIPLIEEITKGLMLLITLRNKNFCSLTNGIIYGGAVGLGFGMIENILYLISFESMGQAWFSFIVTRTIFLSVMHLITTSVFGAFLVSSKLKGYPLKIYLLLTGILCSSVIHFTWNIVTENYGITVIHGFLFLTFAVVILILLFTTILHNERKLIYREMTEEVKSNLIPAGHLEILGRRIQGKSGWINEGIRKEYLKSIRILTLRKIQMSKRPKDKTSPLLKEIELQHERIKKFLSN